jgi:hypothetical protein
MILLFILCVALINVIITLSTDYEKYFYPIRGLLVKPKINGWLFIIFNVIIFLLVIGQWIYQNNLDSTREQTNRSEKIKSDSLLLLSYNSSLASLEMKREHTDTVLFKMLIDAGIKSRDIENGLKKGFSKVIDSTNKMEIRPTVYLSIGKEIVYDSSSNNVFYFTINVTSENATSTGYNLTGSVLIYNTLQGYSHKGHFPFLSRNLTIPKDKDFTTGFHFGNKPSPEIIYLWLRGTYQNEDGTKIYPPISILYEYDFDTKRASTVSNQSIFDKITNIIVDHE